MAYIIELLGGRYESTLKSTLLLGEGTDTKLWVNDFLHMYLSILKGNRLTSVIFYYLLFLCVSRDYTMQLLQTLLSVYLRCVLCLVLIGRCSFFWKSWDWNENGGALRSILKSVLKENPLQLPLSASIYFSLYYYRILNLNFLFLFEEMAS